MRFIFMLSLITLPVFAACPNLAGTYLCDEDRNPSVIQQSVTNRITTYNVDGLLLIADNKTRADSGDDVVIKYRSKCTSRNVLETEIKTYVEGQHFFTAKQELKNTADGYSITTSGHGQSNIIICLRSSAE